MLMITPMTKGEGLREHHKQTGWYDKDDKKTKIGRTSYTNKLKGCTLVACMYPRMYVCVVNIG